MSPNHLPTHSTGDLPSLIPNQVPRYLQSRLASTYNPNAIALKHSISNQSEAKSQTSTLSYGELDGAIACVATWLIKNKVSRVAMAFDNSFAWVIVDLACQQAEVCCVPLPLFFSEAQQRHIIEESQCEYLLTSDAIALTSTTSMLAIASDYDIYASALTSENSVQMPNGTNKITFTSGSTGAPKGVCLSTDSQWKVAESLNRVIEQDDVNHLCLLPLSTLLENIAGIYAPLLHGGTIELASSKERGFEGSRLTDPQAMLTLIQKAQPTSIILVPDLLMVLLHACSQGWVPPSTLSFIAVGGAHVSPALLAQAHAQGLPVYEGYGLSEAVSVSTLNTPKANMIGSAGKALGHNQMHIDNGEVVVTDNHFLGYLNQPDSFYPTQVRTGDLGSIDNGVLTLTGRKKNIMVNSFGRNVSPEWIESLLLGTGLFRQAIVYCEAKPYCVALFAPISPAIGCDDIQRAIEAVNQQLPDYAQVNGFKVIEPCTTENGLLTETGKIKRADTLQHYDNLLAAIYSPQKEVAPKEIAPIEKAQNESTQQIINGDSTMSLYQQLQSSTEQARQTFLQAPIIQRCFSGDFELNDYIAFLQQAYHHVKYTVPLLMATGAKLDESKEWLREAVGEYIEEEMGHQEWILNDLAACGVDKEQARASSPAPATELMVAYAFDAIARKNPLYFFGMVFVLEGTSIALADAAAKQIKDKLTLPKAAFSYLTSHGALDQEHIVFFEGLMNKITDPAEQQMIIHSANMFYRLYGDIFRELTTEHGLAKVA